MREEKASALPLLLDVRRMDENNRAYAYRMLRKNIMTLQLQPGCQLSEAELCEQLAMSRTPVHEALMMLKSEWLVDVVPLSWPKPALHYWPNATRRMSALQM